MGDIIEILKYFFKISQPKVAILLPMSTHCGVDAKGAESA
jgi:hypothetical protein